MKQSPGPVDSLATLGAKAIHSAFISQQAEFNTVTRRARARFEQRDWAGDQLDAVERLGIYRQAMDRLGRELFALLGPRLADSNLWKAIKPIYAVGIALERNFELAETFFNSVTRKIFATVGVNPDIEFVSTDSAKLSRAPNPRFYNRYEARAATSELIERILSDYRLSIDFEDATRDAIVAAERIEADLAGEPLDAIETTRRLFFRDKVAYIMGRIRSGDRIIPLVLPLRNDDGGVHVDAVLMDPSEVSILFSFSRSYFRVEVVSPRELVLFFKSIMPRKPVAELYNSLGFNKHGKTEQYRSLQQHLSGSSDRFEVAEGEAGMVMIVFALQGFEVVFKVIRDRFEYPKQTTRRQVMQRYRLVFERDRVGRLVDAQEFEHLTFDQEMFSKDLLELLLAEAGETVSVVADRVVVKHLYTERKMTPLNLYIRREDDRATRRVVMDYGRAIKDLAAANIFPGDLLLKNFGVTRHGRVVFYDYDELCLLTDCRFRRLPPARTDEDEMAAEPWFSPHPDDIFPEEFERFLGLPTPLRELFIEHHADLFTMELWSEMQQRHEAGEIPDFFPYPRRRRLVAF